MIQKEIMWRWKVEFLTMINGYFGNILTATLFDCLFQCWNVSYYFYHISMLKVAEIQTAETSFS